MFDIKATQAWWKFFHRYSRIYQGTNFDVIVMLGLKLLQCEICQKDAIPFYKTIGNHKSSFEKMHILHNYVSRKLNKKIYTLQETREDTNDVIEQDGSIKWEMLLSYYFETLFGISKYITPVQLDELREFSAYVYESLNNKTKSTNAIELTSKDSKRGISRDEIQMQTFDYYNKTLAAIKGHNIPFKNYKMVFGVEPKQLKKECTTCTKKHQLYMERHQSIQNPTSLKMIPLSPDKVLPLNNIRKTPTETPKVKPITMIQHASVQNPIVETQSKPNIIKKQTPRIIMVKKSTRKILKNTLKTKVNTKNIPMKPSPRD
jgi:hypothetical protein